MSSMIQSRTVPIRRGSMARRNSTRPAWQVRVISRVTENTVLSE